MEHMQEVWRRAPAACASLQYLQVLRATHGPPLSVHKLLRRAPERTIFYCVACLRVDRYAVRLLGFAAPVHHLCSAQRRINHAFRSCTMYGGRAHQLRVSSGVWPLFVHFSASQLAHYAHGNKPGKSHDCVSRAPVVWPWLTRLFLLPDNHRVFPLSAWCAHRRADWGIAVSELFTRVAAWERA
jgi:hypothetical protein